MFRIFLNINSISYSFRSIANQNGVRYSDSTSYFKKYSSSKCKQTVCLHYGRDSPFNDIFHARKGHSAPGKRALGKTWGGLPPSPPGSYAPARTPYAAPVILHQNCKDYLTLTIRIGGIKIKSKLVRNLYAGNEIKQHDVDSLTCYVYYLN